MTEIAYGAQRGGARRHGPRTPWTDPTVWRRACSKVWCVGDKMSGGERSDERVSNMIYRGFITLAAMLAASLITGSAVMFLEIRSQLDRVLSRQEYTVNTVARLSEDGRERERRIDRLESRFSALERDHHRLMDNGQ